MPPCHQAVRDGETGGRENIGYVVRQIAAQHRDFLPHAIGSKERGLKQILSSASGHCSPIVGYVQRFGEFDGFFARENVAEPTRAAGVDE